MTWKQRLGRHLPLVSIELVHSYYPVHLSCLFHLMIWHVDNVCPCALCKANRICSSKINGFLMACFNTVFDLEMQRFANIFEEKWSTQLTFRKRWHSRKILLSYNAEQCSRIPFLQSPLGSCLRTRQKVRNGRLFILTMIKICKMCSLLRKFTVI